MTGRVEGFRAKINDLQNIDFFALGVLKTFLAFFF